MRTLKRIVSLFFISCFLLFSIVGCGSKQDTESSNGKDDSTAKKDETIELRFSWWGGEARHEGTLAAIDAYMKENPNIKIEAEYSGWDGYYQKLVTQLAGQTAPDIIQINYNWLYDLRRQGKFFTDPRDLQDIIDISGFSQASLDAISVDGELQGLPTGLNAVGMIYNKEFFKKNNIPEDIDYWNWDNLIEVGKRVHEADPNQYLLNEFPNSLTSLVDMYLEQQDKEIIKGDFTLGVNVDELTEAYEYVQKLFDNGVIAPFEITALFQDKTEQFPKWLNGEIGMFMQVASVVPALSNNFEVGVVRVPLKEGAKSSGVSINATNIFAVNDNGKHKEEAAKFINWMLNHEDGINVLKDVRGVQSTENGRKILLDAGIVNPVISQTIDIASKYPGETSNEAELNSELKKIKYQYIEMLGYGELSPSEAASEMLEVLEEKIKELQADN
ncbi:ABC transporter substrate-binding protein [Vallitalea guaymasensis]|uniref:Sugar ABC transporter substrate-binding protein n=1 Tax=Vallitalea guaymasensis TaxID=1185412 RepID=A0A8J8SB45_9FIRM|nr:sugar ABC transporter substrate-binding protein [Vallitalea guaymasensis]QUH28342.1 sugar ABC transporter substrate-binding protein [Vallitalea guaymasensis]